MNYLSPPPIRVPVVDENGQPSSEWINFFSDLESLFNDLQRTGTTAQRPNPAPFVGYMHFDTTLGKPVWAKTTTTWVDAAGVAA